MSDKNLYSVVKTVNRPGSRPNCGSFARVLSESGNHISNEGFIYCRESWHTINGNRMEQMLFYHKIREGPNIAAFIRKTELKLKHTKFTEIGPTNLDQVSWVKPAAFWLKNHMRRSLFTVLLRAGVHYRRTRDNWEDAVQRTKYLRETITAFRWFMKGHTWFQGDSNTGAGWHRIFDGMLLDEVKQNLKFKAVNDQQLFKFAMKKLGLTKSKLISMYRKERRNPKAIKS